MNKLARNPLLEKQDEPALTHKKLWVTEYGSEQKYGQFGVERIPMISVWRVAEIARISVC